MIITTTAASPLITDWIMAVAAVLALLLTMASIGLSIYSMKESRAARTRSETATNLVVDDQNRRTNQSLRKEDRAMWEIFKVGKYRYKFTNTGSKVAQIINVREVDTGSRPEGLTLLDGYQDAEIPPGQSFIVHIEKSLASPAVAKVEVIWKEGTQEVRETFLVAD